MAESKSKPPQDIVTEIGVNDLYEFLGVDSTSSDKEITTGYRKKALKYHPDKNPDNPNASDLFQKLSKAYNILTDPAAKAAYDKWLRAKHATKKRHEELNAKRRKLKESLEMRENQSSLDEQIAAKQMQKEIDRLREEGFKKMKEQEEWLRQQMKERADAVAVAEEEKDIAPSLKFRVHHVLVSKKRNGKALVSFHSAMDASRALESGCGLKENPLQIVWTSGKPSTASVSKSCAGNESPLERGEDYERITLMRLRQAQERKRLAEEIQREDKEEDKTLVEQLETKDNT